ncbi:unnamed protein product [Lactuca virosa]|uniref:NB-ARC domain-containing protein n=1 Tax=Lactuca virosa TaxID=75947 RepID=A0AAU9NT43_9ASTR|nr:unnamed protein product [Lactuca virosa]
MAEIVSAFITLLCGKLNSADLMKLAQSKGIDTQLKKLKKTLPLIQAVLAEARNKQITYIAAQRWLYDLYELTYDIDDLLDDLTTEDMRRKLNEESRASISNTVLKLLSSFKSYRRERRLEEIPVESQIIGRERDKEALLMKLLGSDENVGIVSIVGMAGVGKTALAKVLYNEEKLKDHFELRAWVCVTEAYSIFHIGQSIWEAVSGEAKRFPDLNLLHVSLKEKLSKKRFLLVLDDVWNIDYLLWKLLGSPPLVGAPGSKVIVTTGRTGVASVMGSNETYHLEVLSNEDALSLFVQHALGEKNFDKHPTLRLHGEAIVKKCGGLPLALIMLGRVLKTLKLSYYHLPPHLKLLFAYCSFFPKGYVFDKKTLVLMWMAEGFLSQSIRDKSMESLGYESFEELKSRSFFQYSTNDEVGHTMHYLLGDLATSVAGEFFFRSDEEMDVSNMNETFEKLRHFSLKALQGDSYKKLIKELQRSKRLRTFLLMSSGWKSNNLLNNFLVELLPDLQFLRVLSLSGWNITKIPQSIGDLKHLRYLNVSNTRITCLPEQVSDLCNLQSLLVSGCYELSALPESFVNLINLRHLDISRTPKLNKMPLGIGGLTSLQTLPKVVIERDNGFKISDLKDLSNLQGQLSIMGLDKVISPLQAKDANLHEKEGLDVLDMEWSDVFDDYRNEMIEYEVLEELRPHHKLRNLKILFYKGMTFPDWVSDPSFDQLTELTLCGCRNDCLPMLGRLPSLGKLFVKRMNEVETVDFELLSSTNSFLGVAFPSLEVLKFDDMQEWMGWFISGGNYYGTKKPFPRLRLVQLDEEHLMCLGAVEDLYIDRCDELRYLGEPETEDYEFLSSLQKLEVRNYDALESLICPNRVESLTSLEELFIRDCPGIDYSFPCGLWPPNLRSLDIGYLNKPMSEWGPQKFPTSLVELLLYGKHSGVVSFAVGEHASNTTTSCFLLPPSLTSLGLNCFMEVESLSEVLQHLPGLKSLQIWACPKLRDLPETTSSLTVKVWM